MQAEDGKRFRELIVGIGRVYGQEPDRVTLDAYWVALKAWPLAEFESACGHLMRTSKFMPRPADFTELAKAGRLTAGEAWAQVLDYVRNGGYHQWDCGMPTFNAEHQQITDPRINAAVRAIGGYHAVAMSKTDQTHFLERRFAEHFDTISDAEDVRESVPQLTGGAKHGGGLAAPVRMLLNGMVNKP